MRILNKTDLKNIAMGAALLGCGGGGDSYIGRLVAERTLEAGKKIRLIAADELPETSLTMTVGYVGAPAVSAEKFSSPDTLILAIKTLEQYFNISATALIPLEIGGGNAMVPLYSAGIVDIPVVDGDGMGRAFPRIDMTTYHIYGEFEPVAALANDDGYTAICRADSHTELECMVRAEVIKCGGNLAMVKFPLNKTALKKFTLHNTVSTALNIGEFINNLSIGDDEKFTRLCAFFHDTLYKKARVLFTGKIIDVRRENSGGFTLGEIDLQNETETALIKFQNENLIFQKNQRIESIAPDLLVVLDQQTAEPLMTSQYHYGQRVTVIEVSAPTELTSPAALKVLRPEISLQA